MPEVRRNRGAAVAKGERLLFFDANVSARRNNFLEKALGEMDAEKIRLATCWFEPDLGQPARPRLLSELANYFVAQPQDTHMPAALRSSTIASCSTASASLDESLRLAEDHDFVKRAARHAPLHMLESTRIRMSVRRLEKDGRFSYSAKCIQVELYRLFKGEVTEDIVDYRFGYAEGDKTAGTDETLKGLRERLEDWRREHAAAILKISKEMTPEVQDAMTEIRRSFDTLKESVRTYLAR